MIAVNPFAELTDLLTKFIAERDEKQDKGPSNTIRDAIHLIIAVENARNICPVESQAAKVEELKKLIGFLQRGDFSRLDLSDLIRHSIDSGTSDGTKPKLYAVNPKHVVPNTEFTVQFFGKFKYADTTKYKRTYTPKLVIGKHTFEPIEATHHTLTFKTQLDKEDFPFRVDKCSQIFAKLIVPYEVGNIGVLVSQQRTFEFNVPIRALPLNAGTMEVSTQMLNDGVSNAQYRMSWGLGNPIFTLNGKGSKLIFTSFDGKVQEFQGADLEADARACFPNPLVKHGSYLKISQVSAVGEDSKKWEVEMVPPGTL